MIFLTKIKIFSWHFVNDIHKLWIAFTKSGLWMGLPAPLRFWCFHQTVFEKSQAVTQSLCAMSVRVRYSLAQECRYLKESAHAYSLGILSYSSYSRSPTPPLLATLVTSSHSLFCIKFQKILQRRTSTVMFQIKAAFGWQEISKPALISSFFRLIWMTPQNYLFLTYYLL